MIVSALVLQLSPNGSESIPLAEQCHPACPLARTRLLTGSHSEPPPRTRTAPSPPGQRAPWSVRTDQGQELQLECTVMPRRGRTQRAETTHQGLDQRDVLHGPEPLLYGDQRLEGRPAPEV